MRIRRRAESLILIVVLGWSLAVLFGPESWLPSLAMGVVEETAGSDAQLVRLRLLTDETRVLYVPSGLVPDRVEVGEYVLARHDGSIALAARMYPRVEGLWRLPTWMSQTPWELVDDLDALSRGHPLVSGVLGVVLLYLPAALIGLAVGATGGSLAAWCTWAVLRAGPWFGFSEPGPWLPVVLGLAFAFGAVLATTRAAPRAVLLRVVVVTAGLTLASAIAAVLGWPTVLVAAVILVSAVHCPALTVWLVGAYLMSVGLQIDSHVAGHAVFAVAGVVVYNAISRRGLFARLREAQSIRRLSSSATGHIPIELTL